MYLYRHKPITDEMAWLMPRLVPKADVYADVNITHCNGLPPFSISKFLAFFLFLFSAATNKSYFRQIAEASPNPLWIALYLATPLCVFSVTRYRVYSADYNPR